MLRSFIVIDSHLVNLIRESSRYTKMTPEEILGKFVSGRMTMLQYAQAFNDLCQYAGYHADTDEKKRDRFRRGLSTKLRDRLNAVRANNYNELVNMTISQEDCITAC
jgi:predicted PolB exonuclease-like 3'-5' exonuclease